jgi:DHA1 family bicyclomycin/chloramphenicol resistance-like MFS transporter
VAVSLMLAGATLLPDNIWVLILPMVFYATGMGLILPNAMAVALRGYPHMAGTASALLGFIQMGLSASATALVGLFLKTTPVPMLYSMFFITVLALVLSVLLHHSRAATRH